jgi:hypothetical protein
MVEACDLRLGQLCVMIRSLAPDASVNAHFVEVVSELVEFSLEILRVPVEEMVEIFAPDGANEPFHERMRYGHIGHRGHWVDTKDTEVCFPLKELKERVVVKTEASGSCVSGGGFLEHSAERRSVDGDRLDSEANNPPRILVHYDQDPMSLEADRFSPEQIQTPETILGMTQQRKPGRAIVGAGRREVFLQDSANHVFVDVDTESIGDLFGNARTTTPGITALEFKNGLNEFLARTFGSWLSPRLGREKIPVFLPHKSRVDSEQRGWAEGEGGTFDSAACETLAPEGEEESLDWREVRSALSGSIQEYELLLEEKILRDNRLAPARPEKNGDVSQRMSE